MSDLSSKVTGANMNLPTLLVVSTVASFVTVGLKGFQHKNVIGNHLRLVAITSYLMAMGDVLCIGLIIKGGWWIALSAGTGSALGMVFAMRLHDRIFTKK